MDRTFEILNEPCSDTTAEYCCFRWKEINRVIRLNNIPVRHSVFIVLRTNRKAKGLRLMSYGTAGNIENRFLVSNEAERSRKQNERTQPGVVFAETPICTNGGCF